MKTDAAESALCALTILCISLSSPRFQEPVFGIGTFFLSVLSWGAAAPWHRHLGLVLLSGAAVAVQAEAGYYVAIGAYVLFCFGLRLLGWDASAPPTTFSQ